MVRLDMHSTGVLVVEGRRESGCERRHTLLISLEATSSSTAATTLIVTAAVFGGSCARSIALAAPLDRLVGYFGRGRRFLVRVLIAIIACGIVAKSADGMREVMLGGWRAEKVGPGASMYLPRSSYKF